MRTLNLREDTAIDVSRVWWLLVIVGLASAAAGVIFLARPSHSLNTLAVVLGVFVLLDGIAELVMAFGREANRGLAAIVGVVAIVIGLVLVRHPTHAVNALGLLIGVWLVAAGCVRLVRAISEPDHRVLRSVTAVVEICAGIVVVSQPHIGYKTLALVVGIWLVINGLGVMALGIALRTALSGEGTRSVAPTSGSTLATGGG